MTSYFPFTPSSTAVFQFQPTLDGQTYQATVPWLLFGARYYLNLQGLDGTAIWYGAIVGSPTPFSLDAMSWANGIVTCMTSVPHGYRPATTVELTLAGCAPSAYNGLWDALITGPSTFSFLLAADPGPATVLGTAGQNFNLIGGVPDISGNYFTSTLLFRQDSQQFEVSP